VVGQGWFQVSLRLADGYPKRSGGAATADEETGVTCVFKGHGAAVVDLVEVGVERMELPWAERAVNGDAKWSSRGVLDWRADLRGDGGWRWRELIGGMVRGRLPSNEGRRSLPTH
jgi:hypothetical protein